VTWVKSATGRSSSPGRSRVALRRLNLQPCHSERAVARPAQDFARHPVMLMTALEAMALRYRNRLTRL
jgi:hypothetical protein